MTYLQGYSESFVAVNSTAGALAIDYTAAAANLFYTTLTENVSSWNITNVQGGESVTITLEVTQGVGNYQITGFPGNITWLTGTPPLLPADNGIISLIVLTTRDAGVNWIGTHLVDPSDPLVTSVAGKIGAVELEISDLLDVDATGASNGQYLQFNGSIFVAVDPVVDIELSTPVVTNCSYMVASGDLSTFCVYNETESGIPAPFYIYRLVADKYVLIDTLYIAGVSGGTWNSASLSSDGNILSYLGDNTAGTNEIKIARWNGTSYVDEFTFTNGATHYMYGQPFINDTADKVAFVSYNKTTAVVDLMFTDYTTAWSTPYAEGVILPGLCSLSDDFSVLSSWTTAEIVVYDNTTGPYIELWRTATKTPIHTMVSGDGTKLFVQEPVAGTGGGTSILRELNVATQVEKTHTLPADISFSGTTTDMTVDFTGDTLSFFAQQWAIGQTTTIIMKRDTDGQLVYEKHFDQGWGGSTSGNGVYFNFNSLSTDGQTILRKLPNYVFQNSTSAISSRGGSGGSGAVDSVFGRSGVVSAATSDYDALQIDFDTTGTSILSTNVQGAINTVDTDTQANVAAIGLLQADAHTHGNKATIDLITAEGSGSIITTAERLLLGTALQPGDSPVLSVAGKTGVITLVKADITDFNDGDYATAAQGALAATALQDINAESIGDLSDVDMAGAAAAKILEYNGATFVLVDAPATTTKISGLDIYTPVGIEPLATTLGSVLIGDSTQASGVYGVAVGIGARAYGDDATAMGRGARAAAGGVSIGTLAGYVNYGTTAVNLGYYTSAEANFDICIGSNNRAYGGTSINIGRGLTSTTQYGIILGSANQSIRMEGGRLKLGNSANNATLNLQTGIIGSPIEGDIRYDAGTNSLRFYNGVEWYIVNRVQLSAKGDLMTSAGPSGIQVNTTLAVGSNGQILTADSTEANGLRWSNSIVESGGNSLKTDTTRAVDASIYNYTTISNGGALTFTNVPDGAYTCTVVITGVGTTWPLSVKWPGGTAPTLTGAADIITLTTIDNGTTWFGTYSLGHS